MPPRDSTDESSPILTLESVAEYLRAHPNTIYRLLKKNQLPAFKLGRDWRFNRESIASGALVPSAAEAREALRSGGGVRL